MGFQQLDTVSSIEVMASPSLDSPALNTQNSVDAADTVDSIIQSRNTESEDDAVFGEIPEVEKRAGSLLQSDEVLRILRLPARHRSEEDVMMLADMMSKYALLPASN
jgi:hypothetical protein